MWQLHAGVRYLFRSSVQRSDSGVCTVQSARLCVWAAGQLPGPPTHHVLLLADWLEPFLEMEAAGDEFHKTEPPPAALSQQFTPPTNVKMTSHRLSSRGRLLKPSLSSEDFLQLLKPISEHPCGHKSILSLKKTTTWQMCNWARHKWLE